MKQKKFKLYSIGLNKWEDKKGWLNPSARQLPTYFRLEDIPQSLFTSVIMKRLRSAKDGTKVILYKSRSRRHGFEIGIIVIDPFTRKLKSDKLKKLRKRLDELLQLKEIKEYIEVIRKLNLK